MKIAITGSHGFVGTHVKEELERNGHTVFPVLRTEAMKPGTLYWNGRDHVEACGFRGLDAVIHLAGESLFGPWTAKRKERIRSSRVEGTRTIAQALANLPPRDRPGRFLSASAVGYYGDQGEKLLYETSGAGKGFLAGVCREWEEATGDLSRAGICVANLRLGIVLDRRGGILKQISPFATFGLIGSVGTGKQYLSWVSLADVCRAIDFLLRRPLEGPVNLVSPKPVTQKHFIRSLSEVVGQSARLWVPERLAKWVAGSMAEEMLLTSCRAYPRRLLEAGFEFTDVDLGETLARLFGRGVRRTEAEPVRRVG